MLELRDYASKVDSIATEIGSLSRYFSGVPYSARIMMAIAYLQQDSIVSVIPDKKEFIPGLPVKPSSQRPKEDILGNTRKRKGK